MTIAIRGIPAASAQTVSTEVVSAQTAAPVVGAVVYLFDEEGRQVRYALANDAGRVLFFNFLPGRYRLRAELVGMATVETPLFLVRPGQRVERRITLAPQPIELAGLSVEAEERCALGPEHGLATARAWDEARKALVATAFTDEERLYRYQTLVYERDLDLESRVIRRSEQRRREANMRSPFRSRPATELVDRGFVETSATGDLFFAPDANVLLSDVFLDTHCFRLRLGAEGEDSEGLLGLSFEPLGDRKVVDIAGTLWLDPGTSELRWLEYRYLNLPLETRVDGLGGRVEFERMPEGGWIVRQWSIRMPRTSLQRDLRGDELREYVTGLREAGGVVVEVQRAGRPLGHRTLGGLEGTVQDSLGEALSGVRVEVVGTRHAAITDSAGLYSIYAMVEGIYEVRFVDPRLQAFGYAPEPVTRAVFNGELSTVDFQMPSAASVLAAACDAAPSLGSEWSHLPVEAQGTGILVGSVRDSASDAPLPGAIVRALTYRYEFSPGASVRAHSRQRTSLGATGTGPRGVTLLNLGGVNIWEYTPIVHRGMFGFETRADENGFYRICRVPERELVTVIGVYEGVESEGDTVKIMEDGAVYVHTVRLLQRGGGSRDR